MSYYADYDYDDYRSDFPSRRVSPSCSDGFCGGCPRCGVNDGPDADDDDEGDGEVYSHTVTTYTVAQARGSIRVGDILRTNSYFTYIEGGKRTGYHRSSWVVARGPAHTHHDPTFYAKMMGSVMSCRAARRRKAARKAV